MRISDWSSDVCSSDLLLHIVRMGLGQPCHHHRVEIAARDAAVLDGDVGQGELDVIAEPLLENLRGHLRHRLGIGPGGPADIDGFIILSVGRSEERSVGNECVSNCIYRWSPYN